MLFPRQIAVWFHIKGIARAKKKEPVAPGKMATIFFLKTPLLLRPLFPLLFLGNCFLGTCKKGERGRMAESEGGKSGFSNKRRKNLFLAGVWQGSSLTGLFPLKNKKERQGEKAGFGQMTDAKDCKTPV